jgi:ubiquinone/menaquinone biosynthesis C-methylase UbiE
MEEIKRGRRLDFELKDVQDVYEGPVGVLWEMLMGEEIHVGGANDTDVLARKAGIKRESNVLDICSALGGPARHLAKEFGCTVTGLDATKRMYEEAIMRTEREGLSPLVSYRLGDTLEMPFDSQAFDVVWGQDAWCYVTDKKKLLQEASRVIKPGGTIAFTDWIQIGNMSDTEWEALNTFMVFPYLETLEGYRHLLNETGFELKEMEDLSEDFAKHCHHYKDTLINNLKSKIIKEYGKELFNAALAGLDLWVSAADEQKVGRGRWIGRRLETE